MDLLWAGLREALRLLATGDPEVVTILLLSLQVSGLATLISLVLGVPADHDVAYLIGVGYPADRPLRPIVKPNRRPFNEVLHRGHW